MKFIKNLWNTSAKIGLSLFLLTVMLIGAISLVSFTQKGKTYYGNRCKASLNEKAISYLNQEEVISYDFELNCNTLYLDLVLDDSITQDNAKALLVRISSYYELIKYAVDTQISAKGDTYLILASIVDQSLTMSITNNIF